MQSTIELLRKRIQEWERGRIIFIDDFVNYDSQWSVRFGLSRLAEEGFIYRLGRGIYCYPRISDDYHKRFILPNAETIAYAIAERERVRIIPYGDVAAYRLGITGLKISHLKYLTDGAPRNINLKDGKTICFNHTSEVKMFGYRNQTMQLICSALRAIGKERIGEEEKRKIRLKLTEVPEVDFNEDIKLPPAWVADIIYELRGQ